jgi:hypothetical protein
MTATATDTTADRLERSARMAMARLSTMPARGWDGERARADVLDRLDDVLDEWLAEQAQQLS